jgi:acyl dehydratase
MEEKLKVTLKGDWEFEITTDVHSCGVCVYTNVATFLIRNPARDNVPPSSPTDVTQSQDAQVLNTVSQQTFPEDTGRQFACVCKDYNFIHLWRWSARLFGFSRPIAHGMFAAATAIGSLEESSAIEPIAQIQAPVEINVSFVRPILLPAKVEFATTKSTAATTKNCTSFVVRQVKDSKILINGEIRILCEM